MTTVSISSARSGMKDLVNRVAYGNERIYITSRDRKMACLVSMEDLELLEMVEDREDLAAAKDIFKNLDRDGTITHEELMKKIGFNV